MLGLARTAPVRYESVRAALRYRGNGPAIKAVRERYLRSDARRRTHGNRPEPSEGIRHPEPDGAFG